MTLKELKDFGYKVFEAAFCNGDYINGDYNTCGYDLKPSMNTKRTVVYYDIYDNNANFLGVVYKKGTNLWYVPTIIKNTDLVFKRTNIKRPEQVLETALKYYDENDRRNDMYCTRIVDDYRRWCFLDKILKPLGFDKPGWNTPDCGYNGDRIEASWVRKIGNELIRISLVRGECSIISSIGQSYFVEEGFTMWDNENTKQKISNLVSIPVLKNIVPGLSLLTELPAMTGINAKKNVFAELFGPKEKPLKEQLVEIRDAIDNLLKEMK